MAEPSREFQAYNKTIFDVLVGYLEDIRTGVGSGREVEDTVNFLFLTVSEFPQVKEDAAWLAEWTKARQLSNADQITEKYRLLTRALIGKSILVRPSVPTDTEEVTFEAVNAPISLS